MQSNLEEIMKKLSLALAIVTVLGLAAPMFAEANSHYESGNFSLLAGIGYSYWGFNVVPGIDFNIGEFKLTQGWGLDWGIAARGLIGIWSGGVTFGVGGYFMLHFGLKGLDSDFLKKLDWYVGLGVRFSVLPSYLVYPGSPWRAFGFASVDGVQYFLSDAVSIFAEYNYGLDSGGEIGIAFKL